MQCVALGKPFELFWPWTHLRQIPWFPQHPRGFEFLHPLSPCTHVRIGCKPGFSARRGYTHISLFLHRAPRYDPAYQQQSSPLAAAACSSMRVRLLLLYQVGDYFDRSLRCSTPLYAITSRCCCFFFCLCQLTCLRKM